jgi:hypothetical protein
MLPNPCPTILDNLNFAAGSDDFFHSTFAGSVYLDGERNVDITLTQKLNTVSPAFHKANTNKRRLVHNTAAFKSREITDVNDCYFIFENIGKTTFGQTSMERHLSALKTGPYTAAASAIMPFCPPAGGFTFS